MSKIHPLANIHPTAIIGDNVTIEKDVYIGPYCVIGFFPEYPNRSPLDPFGEVYIGRGTIIHGFVSIDSATEKDGVTRIGENCTLMKHSHVGHDAIIGDSVTLSCGAKVGRYSVLEDFVTMGLNSSCHQKSLIGYGCLIGANSFYKGHMEGVFKMYGGVPCREIGDNWRLKEKLRL